MFSALNVMYLLLSGYVETGSPPVGSSRSWKSMEMEIQSLLEKLLDISDAMSRSAASACTSHFYCPTRIFDLAFGNLSESGKYKLIEGASELLSSVRDDISEYKASGSMSPKMQSLRERATVHGSISHIDGKVKLLSDKFPIVSSLLGSIRRRRSRDTLILSAVIAACTLFLIIYWL
ncbi:Golgi SNAP receptor complex member 1 [Quillaja saponaria]|uniref:Golgi SNAP receptor complex member 1 n=1 Tax=Quillaja saponaria TaxID=32244 RepID=A0AAD7LRI3_QUISA|nr:Golgi SNAP receptor complex member 1 [Quillaja saponaria]